VQRSDGLDHGGATIVERDVVIVMAVMMAIASLRSGDFIVADNGDQRKTRTLCSVFPDPILPLAAG
jgi:hypothetical protein